MYGPPTVVRELRRCNGFFVVPQACYLLVNHAVWNSGGWPSARALLALLLHLMRTCLIVQFVSSSALLIGTGDGAFETCRARTSRVPRASGRYALRLAKTARRLAPTARRRAVPPPVLARVRRPSLLPRSRRRPVAAAADDRRDDDPPRRVAGAFNVMLNSLAVSFLLDLDDQMASSPCLIPKQFRTAPAAGDDSVGGGSAAEPPPVVWAPVVTSLARDPPHAQRCLDFAQTSTIFLAFCSVVGASWTQQCRTSQGMPFRLHDTGAMEGDPVNNVTTVTVAMLYFFLFWLVAMQAVVAQAATVSGQVRARPRLCASVTGEEDDARPPREIDGRGRRRTVRPPAARSSSRVRLKLISLTRSPDPRRPRRDGHVRARARARGQIAKGAWKRLALTLIVEGSITFMIYVGGVQYLIADVIMGWKEAGHLASIGEDGKSNYGGDWTQGDWSSASSSS